MIAILLNTNPEDLNALSGGEIGLIFIIIFMNMIIVLVALASMNKSAKQIKRNWRIKINPNAKRNSDRDRPEDWVLPSSKPS